MDDTVRKISAEDVNPRYNWGRALPALGPMGVDFEERVDYRRLHRYRLSRVKQALEKSDLGALLVFDVNNIRYITSTKIGEWERDKLCRWALLTRDGDPILWDFGSAAVHHKLHVPWLKPENCKAGLIGLRGTVSPSFGLMKRHAEEIAALIREAGCDKMPIGVDIIEPPMMFELEKAGLKVADGQQVMLEAREIKNIDEIALLNRSAAMVDGSSTSTAPTTSRRSTPSRASAAIRTRTISPTACCGRATRPSSTSCSRSWATAPATTAPSTSGAPRRCSTMPTRRRANGSIWRSI
jgi:Xaa-Pro dipeptidase